MFRRHWHEPRFWRWWWQNRTSPVLRAVAPWLLLVLLVGGGWIAADRLSNANAGANASVVVERTVQSLVTVREQGKIVRKLVPVVRQVRVRPRTSYRARTLYETHVVTTPGGVRVVKKPVVRLVPKVETAVITKAGAGRTVTQMRVETRMTTVTAERTVTNTAVQTRTVNETRTVVEPRTVTDTATVQRTVTDTLTETAPPVTVTLPGTTVVVTATVPRKR